MDFTRLSSVDGVIVAYLALAVCWPLLWDRFPRAERLLRRLGLFHRWDMMLAPATETVVARIRLTYVDGSQEHHALPANDIIGISIANKIAMDPACAAHMLEVALRGVWTSRENDLTDVALVLVVHRVPPLGSAGVVSRSEHVMAKASVADPRARP
jgi:hypothetical protein